MTDACNEICGLNNTEDWYPQVEVAIKLLTDSDFPSPVRELIRRASGVSEPRAEAIFSCARRILNGECSVVNHKVKSDLL